MVASLTEQDIGALEAARLELSDLPLRLPPVTRVRFESAGRPNVSALKWREDLPLLVLLHGGFENAHVWDLVAAQLERPLLAIDLPGCGSSGRIEHGTYWPPETDRLLSYVLRRVASRPVALVGLSYGGLVALSLLEVIPDCISQLILLDVLPGAHAVHAPRVVDWLQQRPGESSFAELEAHWAGLYPNRSARFRHQQLLTSYTGPRDALVSNADCRPERWTPIPDLDRLWETLQASTVPVALLRAGRSRVVSEEQIDKLHTLRPDAVVHTVSDSSHHIPLHAPEALASLLGQLVR